MSIRLKTFLIIGLTALAFFIVAYSLDQTLLLRGFAQVEEKETVENVLRLTDALTARLKSLSTSNSDWARWDDTYNFVLDHNQAYQDSNLTPESVANVGVNIIVLVTTKGEIVTSRNVDLKTKALALLPPELISQITLGGKLLTLPTLASVTKGMIMTSSGPLLISARPITTSLGEGPSHGTLIFGRFIDDELKAELAEVTHLEVAIQDYNEPALERIIAKSKEIRDVQGRFFVKTLNDHQIAGYTIITDITDRPIEIAQVVTGRATYQQGKDTINYLLIFYTAANISFFILVVILIDWLVIRRILRLNQAVDRLRRRGELTERLILTGHDEFTTLTGNINKMLDSLKVAEDKVRERDIKIVKEFDQIEEKNVELVNTQKAMLNILEDLENEKRRIEEAVVLRTKELVEERAKLLSSINSLPVGFAIINTSNKLLLTNEALLNILELKPEEMTVQGISDKLRGSFDLPAGAREILEQKISINQDNVSLKLKWLHLFLAPILTPGPRNELVGYLLLVEDITERKMLERTREEFFAVASHELRTPLTAIRGNMAMIRDFFLPGMKNPDLAEMINDSYDGAVRLINIVNDFLDVSRLEQGKVSFDRQPVDVSSIITEVVHDLEAVMLTKKLTLKVIMPPAKLPPVLGDKDRIKQVVFNMIGNAANYTRVGGVTVESKQDGDFVKVEITDTGVGISAENQQRLFKKFQQAGEKVLTRDVTQSTGLGLYISKLLVEGMGGAIKLEQSDLGKGSTFSFSLPLAPITSSAV